MWLLQLIFAVSDSSLITSLNHNVVVVFFLPLLGGKQNNSCIVSPVELTLVFSELGGFPADVSLPGWAISVHGKWFYIW